MKKFFSIALMACMTMAAVGLTSCDTFADPEKYPVSGETFVNETEDMTITLDFAENWYAEMEKTVNGVPVIEMLLKWSMSGNDIKLKAAADMTLLMADGSNKTYKSGDLVFNGKYDASARTVTLTSPGKNDPLVLKQR